jgi:short-subunit dehydrogenase
MITATLHESDDVEQAKKNYEIAHKTGVDAEYAAKKIIQAIEKNKLRLKIGKDARIIHFITRFMPGLGNYAMRKIAAKLVTSS